MARSKQPFHKDRVIRDPRPNSGISPKCPEIPASRYNTPPPILCVRARTVQHQGKHTGTMRNRDGPTSRAVWPLPCRREWGPRLSTSTSRSTIPQAPINTLVAKPRLDLNPFFLFFQLATKTLFRGVSLSSAFIGMRPGTARATADRIMSKQRKTKEQAQSMKDAS